MNISFSRALPIFFALQTLIILALLLITRESRDNDLLKKEPTRYYSITKFLYVITLMSILLKLFVEDFMISLLYIMLVIIIPITVLILLVMIRSSPKPIVAVTILWHLMILLSPVPKDGMSITEGVHMTRTMIIYGNWIEELAHNPSYNPFPTIAFLRAAVSYLTSLPWYSWYTTLLLLMLVVVLFDLAIYALTTKLGGNPILGAVAIVIAGLTPYINPVSHAYQAPANTLIILALWSFINLLHRQIRANLILIILLFSTALLTHPTTYVFIFFPLLLPLFHNIQKFINKNFSRAEHIYNKATLISVNLITITIGAIRFTYEALYAKYTGGILLSGIVRLFDLIFFKKLEENLTASITLYDLAGVPNYQALLWSFTIGLATSWILYGFIRKRIHTLDLLMFSVSSIFILLGYSWATIAKASSNLYRGLYVAISFLVPLAALSIGKILMSKHKILVGVALLILLINLALIPNDPELSIPGSMKARGIPGEVLKFQPGESDITKAEILINLLQRIGTLRNIVFSSTRSITYMRYSAYGSSYNTTFSAIGQALWEVMYIRGLTRGDAPIIPIKVTITETSSESVILSTPTDIVLYLEE